ncbi:hypothetical protein FSARC_5530 [Fusarium sarcochroum]|uniref:Uncharacterized protein n=1 Tax=Fusarium sarcochroum TaxID=1208366 RepID=A0A8H4XA24_9HYPO|nr:hypothetical protein FSARC_5530 [Fusarium sarcochroum]
MPLPLSLATLPYEVRTEIFCYYFQLDGGYTFNAESEKLVGANGQPIDLSLMYTCRSIADDTKDLPFTVNTISFSTFYTPRWRAWAGRFEYLSRLHYFLQLDFITYLGQFITAEMYVLIEDKFPGFASMLQTRIEHRESYRTRLAIIESRGDLESEPYSVSADEPEIDPEDEPNSDTDDRDRQGLDGNQHDPDTHTEEGTGNDINSHRESITQDLEFVEIDGHADYYRDLLVYHSRYFDIYHSHEAADMFTWCRITKLTITREAVAYSLRLVAQQQESRFTMLIHAALPRWTASHSSQEMNDLYLDPWTIPSQSSLTRMGEIFGDGPIWKTVQGWHDVNDLGHLLPVVNYREKFRFSAAAAALRFLSHLQGKERMRLRKVVLLEDHLAVGDPECHALGLIPFCQENPRLEIERRLKLSLLNNRFNQPNTLGYKHLLEAKTTIHKNPTTIRTKTLWQELGSWLAGAIYLKKAGMPANSFTLMLDGEPDVGFSSDFFDQVVHRYIACEKAFRVCKAEAQSCPWNSPFAADGVMEAVQKLVNQYSSNQTSPSNSSLVNCNFNPGRPWSIEPLVQERFNWSATEWEEEVNVLKHTMDLPPGYPSFSKRFLENYEREFTVTDGQD